MLKVNNNDDRVDFVDICIRIIFGESCNFKRSIKSINLQFLWGQIRHNRGTVPHHCSVRLSRSQQVGSTRSVEAPTNQMRRGRRVYFEYHRCLRELNVLGTMNLASYRRPPQ
jgi:hypothetical protein